MPHLFIPGLMETPARFYSDKGPRRALKLAVFTSIAGGMFLYETTGTSYEGCKVRKTYQTKKNKQLQDASAMTGEEYMDAVKAAWQHFMKCHAFRRIAGHAMLVHDKARQHTCVTVRQWLQQQGVTAVVQPARSPDMMPLDYGIFGATRAQLGRALPLSALWEDRVATFKQFLSSFDPAPTIGEFPLRMKACSPAARARVAAASRPSMTWASPGERRRPGGAPLAAPLGTSQPLGGMGCCSGARSSTPPRSVGGCGRTWEVCV